MFGGFEKLATLVWGWAARRSKENKRVTLYMSPLDYESLWYVSIPFMMTISRLDCKLIH